MAVRRMRKGSRYKHNAWFGGRRTILSHFSYMAAYRWEGYGPFSTLFWGRVSKPDTGIDHRVDLG